ncbi:MAG: threonine aldolase family protein, partial [Solirubrobacteraceae bacterium]
ARFTLQQHRAGKVARESRSLGRWSLHRRIRLKSFASDNYAAAHPDVLAALTAANDGHAVAYGADPWTARAVTALRAQLGEAAEPLLVFNGSGANIVCLRAACRPWEAVICADSAHVNVDECGAPERIAGVKLLTVATADGKLTPEEVRSRVARVGDEHAVQARLVTISQSTELGTRYEPEEIEALAATAHELGLFLHVDGSRLANAAAALQCGLARLTTDAGVDLLSLGGTKNGMVLGDAVVFLRAELAEGARHLRKQSLQLASKGRFLAAQFVAMYEGDLWLRCAQRANAMAARLAQRLAEVPSIRITQAVQANVVFATVPRRAATEARALWPFYDWDERAGEVRLMCSWDTTEDDVEGLASTLARACEQLGPESARGG